MDSNVIGERLRELRGKRTLEEVAEAVGITKQALSHYETGRRIPRDEVKIRIANYYKKSVSAIFFRQ